MKKPNKRAIELAVEHLEDVVGDYEIDLCDMCCYAPDGCDKIEREKIKDLEKVIKYLKG